MQTITLDRYDLALLEALQRNGDSTNAALGEAIHLSASQVSRRLQRLAEVGIISGYAALIEPAAIGLGVTAFAQVILERHGTAPTEAFENAVVAIPEIMECFSVSGDADYVLRMVAPDLQAFSELMMKRVLRLPGVAHIKTNLALQKVKQTRAFPLGHVAQLARPQPQLVFESD